MLTLTNCRLSLEKQRAHLNWQIRCATATNSSMETFGNDLVVKSVPHLFLVGTQMSLVDIEFV